MTENLINAVISGVIKDEFTVSRNGKYEVVEYIGVSHGKRNCPDKYWEHVYERGGFEYHDSFYGKPDGEGFETAEEAAIAIIKRRGIVAVDTQSRIIRRK